MKHRHRSTIPKLNFNALELVLMQCDSDAMEYINCDIKQLITCQACQKIAHACFVWLVACLVGALCCCFALYCYKKENNKNNKSRLLHLLVL